MYIGDFGNNANERKNLNIYKVPNVNSGSGDKIEAEKISFHYPEQKKFPPKKSKMSFDCEAFFHHNDFLYLITKDRTRPYSGKGLYIQSPRAKRQAYGRADWRIHFLSGPPVLFHNRSGYIPRRKKGGAIRVWLYLVIF